jgi:VanZ family protein
MIETLGGDKLWHVLAFGFLGLMGAIAFPKGHRLFMIIAGLIIFGTVIEIVQFIMPNRSAHLGDIIANLVGLSCGIVVAVSANLLVIRRIDRAS